MWDNRQFNVNGRGKEMLVQTLELAFAQQGDKARATGYFLAPDHGLVLVWCESARPEHLFPAPLTASAAAEMVWAWLESKPSIAIRSQWDRDADHDGDNSVGWRVYCEDWGHVDGRANAIVAVKPVFLWHGK